MSAAAGCELYVDDSMTRLQHFEHQQPPSMAIEHWKRLKPHTGLPQVFAQMTVWNAETLIHQHRSTITRWLASQGEDWLLNVIGINEGKSYFLLEPLTSQEKLSQLLRLDCQGGMVVLERSLLRKELIAMSAEKIAACGSSYDELIHP
ncbi:hypothetical protein [Pseudomonas sp. TH31]|uniref:hypothetical protein n=1 Tax=Pseudomonas sp. TH31 TaxID=2796396 RepID=UPI0019117B21|nr:hypothetical protein [Pseudomonas sp. TH31]MBK5418333.1 hypothetical protein [Pseudomonas sp. TH31]